MQEYVETYSLGLRLHGDDEMLTSKERTMSDDIALLKELAETKRRLVAAVGDVIVGQEAVLEEILVSIFAGGHVLLVGVPGLAKTLIVRTLSELLDLEFRRIQFTPDLMPSDITGTDIIQENRSTGHREWVFQPGPLFANFVLADEINRTPPKTQAALLEAMQERQATVGGKRYPLSEPFFVLATQNPIEQEGTYPLPEAQLDRFMMNVRIDYPATEADEIDIVLRTTAETPRRRQPILDATTIISFQELVRRIPVPRHVAEFAVRLVRSTRPNDPTAPEFVKRNLQWGAGPRAAQFLILGAKSLVALAGKPTVAVEDVHRIAPSVLRHRLITNYAAQVDGIEPDEILRQLTRRTDA